MSATNLGLHVDMTAYVFHLLLFPLSSISANADGLRDAASCTIDHNTLPADDNRPAVA